MYRKQKSKYPQNCLPYIYGSDCTTNNLCKWTAIAEWVPFNHKMISPYK